ncbi:MAG TPA: ORF6N domain-containing protein [Bryobacteraceae bacterium]|nr:ORF6N domain-containing protein [Bryobacteraceae bacterium]
MATKTKAVARRAPVAVEVIQRRIYLVRGQKVMTDADLAKLYQVETKVLNRAVQRNLSRFPDDFMFRLTPGEAESLRCQIGTSKVGRGGRRYLPLVFTEHGVVMLSSVLKSERSVQMNILVVRAFVKLREMLASHKDLANKMIDLERQQRSQGQQLSVVYTMVRKLMEPPRKRKRTIGFRIE